MGLLLANTAAGQTAQERSIREELSEIKEMIQNRLGGERKELSLESGAGSSSGGPALSRTPTSRKPTSASGSSSSSASAQEDDNNVGDSSATESSKEPTQEEKAAARQRKLDTDLEEKCNDIAEAVAHVKISNDDAMARKTGYGMMEMLLKNLAENPMQPRYRKIAIGNKNFERCLKKT